MRRLNEAIVERRKAEDRNATLRAGLIASTIVNMSGKVSRRVMRPEDYLPKKKRTPEQLRADLLSWASSAPGVTVTTTKVAEA